MKKMQNMLMIVLSIAVAFSCEVVDVEVEDPEKEQQDTVQIALKDVAGILAQIPLQDMHVREVYGAVGSSSGNGYDEEYTMKHIFGNPGAGVGEKATKAPVDNPLRDLIEHHVRSGAATKAGAPVSDADAYLEALVSSDIQIYWPYSDGWNGETLPVITFDPENEAKTNIGYKLVVNDDGSRHVEEVVVDEAMAAERPVWVVNRNSDAEFTSLEMLRREDPDWGEGGGTIIIEQQRAAGLSNTRRSRANTKGMNGRSLILKDFTMKRNYDSWFAGASEFWVKIGAVEDFTAVTEAEMYLYNPSVTDFMIVVKRNQMGKPQPFNAVLVSSWTDQMVNSAFMITEDDGGTRTQWKCTALVRVESRSFGIELELPFNSRDDIVWRGQLASKWLEAHDNIVGHFGDVDLTFEVVEY